MSSDLLFSILPREGKVPIAHDSQKVVQIDKQEALRPLNDEEKVLNGEEREAKKRQQKKQGKNPEQQSSDDLTKNIDNEVDSKHPKGPKHLDIYV
jgi:hypothetical protein